MPSAGQRQQLQTALNIEHSLEGIAQTGFNRKANCKQIEGSLRCRQHARFYFLRFERLGRPHQLLPKSCCHSCLWKLRCSFGSRLLQFAVDLLSPWKNLSVLCLFLCAHLKSLEPLRKVELLRAAAATATATRRLAHLRALPCLAPCCIYTCVYCGKPGHWKRDCSIALCAIIRTNSQDEARAEHGRQFGLN